MLNNIYVLEVIRFITEKDGENGWLQNGGKYEHLGYMKAKFKTKNDACSYYDRHNPHMRSLNAHNTWESDWDPNTKLLYIVRKDYCVNDSIPPFSEEDLPINNNGSTEYKYLK
jgi:predicted nucleotidyltransferase